MLKFLKTSVKKIERPDYELNIDGSLFHVEVVDNSRSKRLTLRLKPDGRGAKVTTPSHVGDREIASFIEKNKIDT